MGVSKNRGTPKWMVLKENPIKMDDLGIPLFLETSIFLVGDPYKPSFVTVTGRGPPPMHLFFCLLF